MNLRSEILTMLNKEITQTHKNKKYSEPIENINEEKFYNAVETAKHHIFEGDIFQIVLSIAFS